MCQINKILTIVSILIAGIIYVLLPSVNMDSLMNGTQSGKTFIFLYMAIIMSVVLFLQSFLFNKAGYSRINILDVFLLIWCLYVILDGYLQNVPFPLRLFEFYGLIILYIALRQIRRKYFIWLYVALILGGVIQAVYGNLQLWGYYPSHHGLFKMTGSFFNPGPYAGYLATVFPVLLGLYLFTPSFSTPKQTKFLFKLVSYLNQIKTLLRKIPLKFHFFYSNSWEIFATEKQSQRPKHTDYFAMKSLVLISIICMCLVLTASSSRAAWLAVLVSSFYLFLVKHRLYHRVKTYFDTWTKKLFLLVSLLILLTISGVGLYHLKKGSADGRLMIWKVSINMIKDRPVLGYGFDQFKAHYMDYQATYFEQNPDSEDAMVAGDNNYAFNELLQQTIENGVLGLVIIASILILIFMPPSFSAPDPRSKIQTQGFPVIAKAGIISILVFGLFSYPSQILPIKTNLVLYLATVAGLFSQKKVSLLVTSNGRTGKFFSHALKIIFPIAVLLSAYVGGKSILRFSPAYRHWNNAHYIYQVGAYEACLEDYRKAYPVLNTNGDFLTNYGKALSMAGKHSEAVNVLQQATKYYPNTVVYTALGDSYKKLGQSLQAEQAYLYAWQMNPSRFYPKYLLAKLYDETGQKEKAVTIARELLEKEVKIESTAVREIREEMKKIIEEEPGSISIESKQ